MMISKMDNKRISCSIYCMSHDLDWKFTQIVSDILERKKGEVFEYEHLRKHLLNESKNPNEDNIIDLLEKAHFPFEHGVFFQNDNTISPNLIDANNNILKDLVDVLASNDILFILKNKLWKSKTEIEFQLEIIHEDDIFKYVKE